MFGNTDKAYHWTFGLMGKTSIGEMNIDELLVLIANLICREKTGHSFLKKSLSQRKYKKENYWVKKFKIPFVPLFVGIYLKKLTKIDAQ